MEEPVEALTARQEFRKGQEFEPILHNFSLLLQKEDLIGDFDIQKWKEFESRFGNLYHGLKRAFHEGGDFGEMENHPLALIVKDEQADLEFLNFAVFMPHEFIPSSGPIEFFRLMRSIDLKRKISVEETALEGYRTSETNEEQRKEQLTDSVITGYLELFNQIKASGKRFFSSFA